jgi:hypothetical protein
VTSTVPEQHSRAGTGQHPSLEWVVPPLRRVPMAIIERASHPLIPPPAEGQLVDAAVRVQRERFTPTATVADDDLAGDGSRPSVAAPHPASASENSTKPAQHIDIRDIPPSPPCVGDWLDVRQGRLVPPLAGLRRSPIEDRWVRRLLPAALVFASGSLTANNLPPGLESVTSSASGRLSQMHRARGSALMAPAGVTAGFHSTARPDRMDGCWWPDPA